MEEKTKTVAPKVEKKQDSAVVVKYMTGPEATAIQVGDKVYADIWEFLAVIYNEVREIKKAVA